MYHATPRRPTPAQNEPLAIVGMACRLPGGVESLDDYWSLMIEGRDGIVDIPEARLSLAEFYDARAEAPGKIYVRQGGFLRQDITEFDAGYFGMSPREAGFLDPQQRVLLEVAHEAIEDAGLQLDHIRGSDTGVFVGGFMVDGMLTQFSPLGRESIGQHTAVSSTLTILSNRISYLLDLRGPSFTLDTACSSSLVAFHQACQAIRSGDCSMALVGGVNMIFRPETLIAMCKGGFLSRDGRSKSFDARADGYGRGEGAGMVVVRPLADARAAGDRIYAIVRGTGTNQDGRTDGITAPNGQAQAALIREVCASSNCPPETICYVEAHGTGTAIGDPIEMSAIGSVFGNARNGGAPCPVGSVKANIGHLEAAAGIASVIKTALCLHREQVPPVANLQTVNPALDLDGWNLTLPRVPAPLSSVEPGLPSRAAVNSFGYGGSNAHIILESATEPSPVPAARAGAQEPARPHLLILSARSVEALRALAARYLTRLEMAAEGELADLCYSAALRRSHYEHRLAVFGADADALADALGAHIEGREHPALVTGTARHNGENPVFVYTGMGPQWWGMGQELYASQPVYRDAAEQVDAAFQAQAGWSVLAEMMKDEAGSRVTSTQIAQPANFVVQTALTALLNSWGVHPAAIVGHSVGEVSASHAAGVLDLEAACRVSHLRSQLQARAAGLGGMLAVGASAGDIAHLLAGHEDKVSIAAQNGPSTITLAGDEDVLDDIAAALEETGTFNRKLAVEVAYHSPTMEPLLPELRDGLLALEPLVGDVDLYSTVRGTLAEEGDYDADYWCRNVRDSVLFAQAVSELLQDGHDCFLEVGPHPVLSNALRECMRAENVDGTTAVTLRRGQPEMQTLVSGIAKLFVTGAAVDWRQYYTHGTHRFVTLPSYPWQRQTFWNESDLARADRLGTAGGAPLLGRPVDRPDTAWASRFNRNRLAYVLDHRVEGSVVMPGAAYVELALEAAASLHGDGPVALHGLAFSQAMLIGDFDEPTIETSLVDEQGGFAIHSRSGQDAPWVRHADGRISSCAPALPPHEDLAHWQNMPGTVMSPQAHYDGMTARGLQYGPMFQGVQSLRVAKDHRAVLARIAAPEGLPRQGELLHPALLDACFQTLISALPDPGQGAAYVPTAIADIRLTRPVGDAFWCIGRLGHHDAVQMVADLTLVDDAGEVLVDMRGITARSLGQATAGDAAQAENLLARFELLDAPVDAGLGGVRADSLVVLHGNDPLGLGILRSLESGAQPMVAAAEGAAFVQGKDEWQIRPGHPEDIGALLGQLGEAHVIDLRALAPLPQDPVGQRRATELLAMLQALPQDGVRRHVDIVLPMAPGNPAAVAPDAAATLGLSRVAANEYGDLDIRMIAAGTEDCDALVAAILTNDGEDDIVISSAGRQARRLVQPAAAQLEQEARAQRPTGSLEPGEVEAELVLACAADAQSWLVLAEIVAPGGAGSGLAVGQRVLTRCTEVPPRLIREARSRLIAVPDLPCDLTDSAQLAILPAILADALIARSGADAEGTMAVNGAQDLLSAAAGLVWTARGGNRIALPDRVPTLADLDAVTQQAPGGIAILWNARAALADRLAALLGDEGCLIDLTGGQLHGASLLTGHSQCLIQSTVAGMPVDGKRLTDSTARVAAWLREGQLNLDALAAMIETDARRQVVGQTDPMALARARAASVAAPRITAEGSYLITGGLGGFGFEVAKWLARQGARHLVLAGRKGPATPGCDAMLAQLAELGADARAIALDVSDAVATRAAVAGIGQAGPGLRGIVHAAGILDDGPVYSLSPAQLARVMAPKAIGAWNLHEASRGHYLDLFLMVSSIAALLGSPGQGAYVAANTVQDALAHSRRAEGLAAISLNLGALAEVGMAARHDGVEKHFERVGVGSLRPAEALEMLGQILALNPVNMAAARMDWGQWGATYTKWAASPRYRDLMPARDESEAANGGTGLAALSPDERREQVQAVLSGLVASILRQDKDSIDHTRSLLNMGVDSLMAMELQAGIERRLNLRVPTLELMKGVPFTALIQRIADQLESQFAGETDTPAPVIQRAAEQGAASTDLAEAIAQGGDLGALLADIDKLNPEDIERAIAALELMEQEK